MKRVLSRLLPSTEDIRLMRARLLVPLEFYFLCSGLDLSVNSTSARVVYLTALLRHAAETGQPQHMAHYQAESKWSKLLAWSIEEKLAHFQHCLESILPDNLHCIDRMAVALDEDTGQRTVRDLRLKARVLLLHYAVLRQIIAHPLQRPLVFFRHLTARPLWVDSTRWTQASIVASPFFKLVRALETHFDGLQREILDAAADHRFNDQQEGIHTSGIWSEISIVEQERPSLDIVERLPRLMLLLKRSQPLEIVNAKISLLQPGTHILPHCGISNAKIRLHLPLRVPAPIQRGLRRGLRVASENIEWVEGKVVVFDDSFEHEVWWEYGFRPDESPQLHAHVNTSRVVLIVDVFHPDLGEQDRAGIRSQYAVA